MGAFVLVLAIAAIRELPAGTWSHTCTHDPIPGVAEDGIPITAHVNRTAVTIIRKSRVQIFGSSR